LRFHDSIARPLGERGLYWLLVHLATLYGGGIDKQAFSARQAWSEARIGEIRESVEDPLHGSRWWLTAEKPFQFLAAANELVRALRHPGGPATFKSSLPVHTDGSCNGLQHYAALGRDLWGGSCVNLTPSDKPQDVYARVLDTVRSKLATEAATPSSPRARMAAKLLAGGGVTRKIVKQTVMTSVYGVTHIGARDQILARLQERPDLVASFGGAAAQQITDATAGGGGAMAQQQQPQQRAMGEDDLRAAAGYLAQLTLSSLFDAFAGARRIQDWLGDCAVRMASLQQPVSWVTPLGLPVIQPYRQAALHTVHTALQAVTLVDHSDLLPVSALRQKSAFPPNFIHSLDASHMLRTALACQGKGVAFASVHDSFWTHAGAMDELSGALRQEFVQLYEQPILEQVRDAWQARFPEITLPPVPKRGQLDIKEVLKSPYFFN
jgi:DNA-directed RNA polymerase